VPPNKSALIPLLRTTKLKIELEELTYINPLLEENISQMRLEVIVELVWKHPTISRIQECVMKFIVMKGLTKISDSIRDIEIISTYPAQVLPDFVAM
jgi:hypothetical protein